MELPIRDDDNGGFVEVLRDFNGMERFKNNSEFLWFRIGDFSPMVPKCGLVFPFCPVKVTGHSKLP
jgi:hypothetical protein